MTTQAWTPAEDALAQQYEQYEHHGANVWVRADHKGRHRNECLCFACERLHPGGDDNCPRAQDLYEFCVAHDMTLVIWECPLFAARGIAA